MSKRTSIQVYEDAHRRLTEEHNQYEESIEDTIVRLMDHWEDTHSEAE